ncbi:MAG TPA: hypothetical protein VF510_16035 [Ktedonobacterales bacterium]
MTSTLARAKRRDEIAKQWMRGQSVASIATELGAAVQMAIQAVLPDDANDPDVQIRVAEALNRLADAQEAEPNDGDAGE